MGSVDPWGGKPPGELIIDDESDIGHSDADPDNNVYFALTCLVCLQTFHVNPLL